MKKSTRVLHLTLVLVLVLFDQITKVIAYNSLSDGSYVTIINKVLRLTYSGNTGATWGIMQGNNLLFIILVFLVSLLVIWFYFSIDTDKRFNPLRYTTIFIFAGAIGNLIDRIRIGEVIDFIYFEIIDFPIFNVADCYITISAFLFVILLILKYRNDDIKMILPKKFRKEKSEISNEEEQNSQIDIENNQKDN